MRCARTAAVWTKTWASILILQVALLRGCSQVRHFQALIDKIQVSQLGMHESFDNFEVMRYVAVEVDGDSSLTEASRTYYIASKIEEGDFEALRLLAT